MKLDLPFMGLSTERTEENSLLLGRTLQNVLTGDVGECMGVELRRDADGYPRLWVKVEAFADILEANYRPALLYRHFRAEGAPTPEVTK